MLAIDNGRKIHFEINGNPAGRKLMLLNSLGTSLRSWDEVVGLLGDQYHVLRIDKSGHGQSDPHPGTARIADNTADVLAVMDAVQWDKASVCGVSIGGMTIIDMAIHYPDRLDKIIISNSSSYVSPENLMERCVMIDHFGLAFVADKVVGRFFVDQSTVSSNRRYMVALKDFLSCDGADYINWCNAIVAMDYRDQLHEIKAETLVITGQHDKATPAHMGQYLHASIKGSTMIELPYGHIPYMDNPEKYAGILKRFIS
ncbi:MAG: alpha/beta fold hydrolase [Castellaniella sp.]|uniref:alpha/beta fold hydrolase n=1 Tax=Castellaniella sp. TaxID=1955812 RepID=UPI003C73D96B